MKSGWDRETQGLWDPLESEVPLEPDPSLGVALPSSGSSSASPGPP